MKVQTDLYSVPMQEIHLERIDADGYILDIGGGGEGLVSRIEGGRVCSVDISMTKLRDAQLYGSDAQWIVSDGRNLCLRENTFSVATVWFSLGYLGDWQSKRSVFTELTRVLKSEGKVSILASRIDCKEEKHLFNARFILPDGNISQVGYKVKGNQSQTLESTRELMEKAGFKVTRTNDHEYWFWLEGVLVRS